MQAKLFCIFISPAQRFKGTNRNSVKNRLSETMFSNFCYDWPEATPYPPDIRRTSAGYPPDIRRTFAGYPPDAVSLHAVSRGRLRPAVTKIRKHSFVEAVYRSFPVMTLKT